MYLRKSPIFAASTLVIYIFVVAGVYLLLQGHAATPVVTVEPENGSLTPTATVIMDTGASSGAAIKFGPAPATGSLYNSFCSGSIVKTTSGTMKSSLFKEISGIAASRNTPGVYWVHNDSGDSPRVFSVKADGTLLGIFNFAGASASDWEDIALGPGPVAGGTYIYAADIGDNGVSRPQVFIYRVAEPNPNLSGGTTTLSGVDKLGFKYSDGKSHNAEAMFVDEQSGELYILEKSQNHVAAIFRAPANLANGSSSIFTQVGTISYPSGTGTYETITGADMSPDNNTIAVRTYGKLRIYSRPNGTSVVSALAGKVCLSPAFSEQQGEAVGFKVFSQGVVTTSEGLNQPIYNFDPR